METVTISLQTFQMEHAMCKELSTLQNVASVSIIIHSGNDVTLGLQDWGGSLCIRVEAGRHLAGTGEQGTYPEGAAGASLPEGGV